MLVLLPFPKRALALAVVLLGSVPAAQAVATYSIQARTLTVPAVNVPGSGSFQAQLVSTSSDPTLRVGTILQVVKLDTAGEPVELSASYTASDQIVVFPSMAVRAADGSVNYFDVKLRSVNSGNSESFVVIAMDEAKLSRASVGPAGPKGDDGSRGATGATGTQGLAGVAGVAGAVGPAGATGATGLTGAAGATGAQGVPGIQGLTGATGASGSGGMAGSSSSYVVNLTTVAGGLVGLQGVLPLYGYVNLAPTTLAPAVLGLAEEAYAMAQPFPSNTTLTKIQATVSTKVALSLVGSTVTVQATLYKGPSPSSMAATTLQCSLSPALTGILSIGSKATCSGTGSVSVTAGEVGFLVFSGNASGLSLLNNLSVTAAVSVAP